MKPWQTPSFKQLLDLALTEDLALGDITTELTIAESNQSEAVILAKSSCIVCGHFVAEAVFNAVNPAISYHQLVPEKQAVESNTKISKILGSSSGILAAERTALNFMQRMTGIATLTAQMVDLVKKYDCKIIDTRKTIPGFRALDKYAVKAGGGQNHRFSLGDGILIKENHIHAAGSIKTAVSQARQLTRHNLLVQIEVKDMFEVKDAVEAGADAVLLDNMRPEDVDIIAQDYGDKIIIECSGNLSTETVQNYARAGAHLLSMGILTHSVKAADLSLLFI